LGALLALGAAGYINAASGLPVVLGSFGARCVLPSGFHRIRHYGLLANAGRKNNIATVRKLLHPLAPMPKVQADPEQTHTPNRSVPPTFVCRHCGAPMIIIETFARAQHIRAPPCLSRSP
jgi:hypothetical protein